MLALLNHCSIQAVIEVFGNLWNEWLPCHSLSHLSSSGDTEMHCAEEGCWEGTCSEQLNPATNAGSSGWPRQFGIQHFL